MYGLDNEFDKAKFKKDWPTDYLTTDESVHSQYADLQFRHSKKLYQTVGLRRDTHTTAGGFSTYRSKKQSFTSRSTNLFFFTSRKK